MRPPAATTLLTSPLVTHVSSGAALTAAAARGRAPASPEAARATPATVAVRRRRRRRARRAKAAARPVSRSTGNSWEAARLHGGSGAGRVGPGGGPGTGRTGD